MNTFDNLSLIAAIGCKNELGMDGHLIWKIPDDLKFYREMTLGKFIIMGRKTFETMPYGALDGRKPIILSSKNLDDYFDVSCFNNVEQLLNFVSMTPEEFMVVGGAKVYEELLPYVKTMYLTEIMKNHRADAYFPLFNESEWNRELMLKALGKKPPCVRYCYTRKLKK